MENNKNSDDSNVPDTSAHGDYYSESGFWDKIKGFASKIGAQGVYIAFILYYVLIDSETPTRQKGVILGALGYLILPLDLVPDLVPILGFSDDLAALSAALKMIWSSVHPRHLTQAEAKTRDWFPRFEAPSLRF